MYNSTTKRQPNLKIGQRFQQIFLQRTYTNGPKSHERCLTSTVIREIQVKTTVRHHLMSIRMALKNTRQDKTKQKTRKYWQGHGETGILTLLMEIKNGAAAVKNSDSSLNS